MKTNYRNYPFEGRKYGRLLVLNKFIQGKFTYLHCQCDCGKEVDVRADAIYNGKTFSCGCYHKDRVSRSGITHGKSHTRLYQIWLSMNQRCSNPNAPHFECYGGRGIEVCKEWRNDFKAFYDWAIKSGYKENAKHGECTIDRVDNSKGYFPENCRWTNQMVQSNNTRRNRYITHNGETHTIAEWARILNIPYERLITRIKRGWEIERAFYT